MNIFDRAIAEISPEYAYRRLWWRQQVRAYAAAQTGKRKTGFGAVGGSANVNVGASLSVLRDRASALVRDTAHGHAIVDGLVRNIVGTGIRPVWNTGSDSLDTKVTSLWEQWAASADVEGETDFYAQQELAVRCMIERGESLFRFIDLRMNEAGPVPLRLQLLEGDHIDSSRDVALDGNRVRLGVALGDYNRRLGYYLFPEHPGERIATATSALVPRSEIRHVYRPLRIGQVRGISWLAPILLSAKDLADLYQFTIVKEQVGASFAGYVTSQSGMPSVMPATTKPTGERTMLPEPGSLYEMGPGQDIKFPQLPGGGQFATVALATLQAMAIGVGLTYDQATGDLRQANYSSLRAGKIEHWAFVEQVQAHCVIPRTCDAVADRFVDRAILAGVLRPRKDGYGRSWVPPARQPINPKDDLEADINAVRSGRLTPQEFIAQWGYDWRKVVSDNTTFWAAIDKAKLALDIDPRKPRAGAGAGGPAAAPPQGENPPTDPPPDNSAG